ncbi:MAG: hypothetical protein MGF17_01360 [Trichodesmium sp. MAG_R04]|nr:hypothetical protein [Trichodesmium sp. MAG_R04]
MNATEQAKNFKIASKIAAIVNLFKSQFPDIRVDLKPWMNDPDTLELVDPNSIDIAFHFPGRSWSLESRCLLVQIRFDQEPIEAYCRLIGVEVAGYDHRGEQWKLSTVGGWYFVGNTQPKTESAGKLKDLCRQIFELFNNNDVAA